MSTIKLRRSGVSGKKPTVAQLDLGELALNTYDGYLYIKKNVDGQESIVGFYGAPVNEETIFVDTATGDGSTTDFTLSRIPKDDQYVYVSINGIRQHISEYSLVGNVLTFGEAPANNDIIEFRTHESITNSVALRDYQTYVYTANNDTSFSGVDSLGKTLEYDIEKIEVYANGSRLVNGFDYTATDGSSITILESITGTVEVVSLSRSTFSDTDSLKPVDATFTTTTANQVIDAYQAVQYRTSKYLVQMTSPGSSAYHVTEVVMVHDGTDVYISEYGTIQTGISLGTITGDISGGFVRLLVTPTVSDLEVKAQRLTITV